MGSFSVEVLRPVAEDARLVVDMTQDGHLFWFESISDKQGRLVWDGTAGPIIDNVAQLTLAQGEEEVACFSPDMRHVAYVVFIGERMALGIDGDLGPPFSEVLTVQPVFSADGSRIAYGATVDGATRLVVDHEPILGFELAPQFPLPFAFSPDALRLAFVASDGERVRVVVDGVPGESWDAIQSFTLGGVETSSLTFCPEGRRVFYQARRGKKRYVVVDGVPDPAFEQSGRLVVSPDGSRYAYEAVTASGSCTVLDGQPGSMHKRTGTPVFSPDSRHVAYPASDGKEWWMTIDEEPHARFAEIHSSRESMHAGYVFSPDSRRFAYLAREGRGLRHKEWFVVVDGEKGPPLRDVAFYWGDVKTRDRCAEPVFSPDNRHLAVAARVGNDWSIVTDSVPGPGFHAVFWPVFSADGDTLAYLAKPDKEHAVVVTNGSVGPVVDDIAMNGSPFLIASGDAAYAARIGTSWYAIVGETQSPACDVLHQPRLTSDGSVWFWGVRKGQVVRLTWSP